LLGLSTKENNFEGGASKTSPKFYFSRKRKKEKIFIFYDCVHALKEQFCWGAGPGSSKSPSHVTFQKKEEEKNDPILLLL
jgi:hypothetical protein